VQKAGEVSSAQVAALAKVVGELQEEVGGSGSWAGDDQRSFAEHRTVNAVVPRLHQQAAAGASTYHPKQMQNEGSVPNHTSRWSTELSS
jgi:hypothetical protein